MVMLAEGTGGAILVKNGTNGDRKRDGGGSAGAGTRQRIAVLAGSDGLEDRGGSLIYHAFCFVNALEFDRRDVAGRVGNGIGGRRRGVFRLSVRPGSIRGDTSESGGAAIGTVAAIV